MHGESLQHSLAVLLFQGDGSFWMPPKGSTTAAEVDWLFYFIFWVSMFFFTLIVTLMVVFLVRYRRRPGREEADELPHHNLALELVWSIIPLGLVVVIFWVGFQAYLNMSTAPPNAYEIRVTGMKWQWLFTYPNGWADSELHAPKGVPIKLTMTSEDVIHSLYIPDFRLKKDVVPGRYTSAWFQADEVGEHNLFCAEYCGKEHSSMLSRVIIQEPEDYLAWLENAAAFYDELPPVEAGAEMLKKYGCVQCHHVDSTASTGPPLNDLFGREEQLAGSQTITVDENYVRQSILEPDAEIVRGYQNVMPTFQGKIKDKEIDWIIAYLKDISSHYEQPELLLGTPEAEAGEAAEATEPAVEAGVDEVPPETSADGGEGVGDE
ncbi:cytochrome c oxidase subunit II [bacterium]|nr:cytochrome c oxidase subunit II [bacterium]